MTVRYPEERLEPADRFRGMFRFCYDRCIACKLCAVACPIDIIYIDVHDEQREVDGKMKKLKVLDRYDIDVKRCMFCSLCEEACPTKPKSIWLTTKTYELASYDRNDLYFNMQELEYWDDRPKYTGPAGRRCSRRRSKRRRSRSPEATSDRQHVAVVFLIIGTIAVASSILVVAMRNPVHSALFLLLTFLCVAVLFVMKGAEFVAAVQVLVYAGGIMVLFLFVVMLINVRHLPDERVLSNFWKGGFAVGLGVFILFVSSCGRASITTNGAEQGDALTTCTERISTDVDARCPTKHRASPRAARRMRTPRRSAMALYTRLPRAVRSRVALPARGDDRRDRHRQARAVGGRRRDGAAASSSSASRRRRK